MFFLEFGVIGYLLAEILNLLLPCELIANIDRRIICLSLLLRARSFLVWSWLVLLLHLTVPKMQGINNKIFNFQNE